MANVRISWKNPTTRVDGKPLPPEQLKHVILEMSADAGQNFIVLARVAPSQTSFDVTDLDSGTYLFRLIAVDSGDRLADPSGASITIEPAVPAAPSPVFDVQVVIVP